MRSISPAHEFRAASNSISGKIASFLNSLTTNVSPDDVVNGCNILINGLDPSGQADNESYLTAISYYNTIPETISVPTANSNPWTVGYPTVANAAQAIINALKNYGGNQSNANSLQSQWNAANANSDGNAMSNVLSGADNEIKAQLWNKHPSSAVQNSFLSAYNKGIQSASSIEGLVTTNNSFSITLNVSDMIYWFMSMSPNVPNVTLLANTSVHNFNQLSSTLWDSLTTQYLNQINIMINGNGNVGSGMNNQSAVTNLNQQLAAAISTIDKVNYNYTNMASTILSLYQSCGEELINEVIVVVDGLIYAPYKNYTDKLSKAPNELSGLDDTWEETKWQISDDSNLASVPYEIVTGSEQTSIDSSGRLYWSNGSNLGKCMFCSGTVLYKCTNNIQRSQSLNNFYIQWQGTVAYQNAEAKISDFQHFAAFFAECVAMLLPFVGEVLSGAVLTGTSIGAAAMAGGKSVLKEAVCVYSSNTTCQKIH